MAESEPRRWTGEHPDGGRRDARGVTWYACDPYPTWFRWHGGDGDDDGLTGTELVIKPYDVAWEDGLDDFGSEQSSISCDSHTHAGRAFACEWCSEVVEAGDDVFTDGNQLVDGEYCSDGCLEMMAENQGVYY